MARNLDANALLAHGRFLRALARDLLGDEHLAEDVVQETWIRALRSGPRKNGSLRPWLATVARNLARDRGRSEGARRARERKVARPEAVSPAERFGEQQRVASMVANLEPPYRDVLILRYVDDLTPVEIARRLDVPAATVRTRIHRALGMLRARLDAEHGGDRSAWSLLLLPLLKRPRRTIPLSLIGGVLVSKLKYVAVVVLLVALWGVYRGSSEAPARADRAAVAAAAREPDAVAADEPDAPVAPRRVLRGRVLFADGSPAPQAVVTVHRYEPDHTWYASAPRRGRPAGRVECDAEGRFEAEVPPEDNVLLRATSRRAVAERKIRAGAQPREGIEIRLRPTASATLFVVDEQGSPVEGAEVTIGPPLFDDQGEPTRFARTDADGRATVEGIAIDAFGRGVTVRHPGYAVATRVSAVVPNAVWTIRLVRGETYRGVVLDAARRPVPDARVRWICEHERFGSGETQTDRAGHFTIAHLPPYPCALFLDGAERGHGFVRLSAPPHPPELLLDEIRERSGVVVEESGAPVAGVRVFALGDARFDLRTTFSNGISLQRFPERLRVATTDEEGRFAFRGLSARAQRIGISARAPYRRVETIEEGGFVRIVVAPAPVIRGRVVDPQGQPVPDARVVRPGGYDYERYSDPEGRFAIHPLPGVGAGRKTKFRITRAGYARLEVETEELEPVFELQPVKAVTGRLLDASGAPVAGARIGVDHEYLFSGHDGRFFLWLSPGRHQVRIQRDGYRYLSRSVEADGGARDLGDLTLEARAPARLRGTVVDPSGHPLAGVVVQVRAKQPGVFDGDGEERTDLRGRFDFSSLSEGEVRVEVRHEPFAPYRKAGIALRGELELAIELRSALRIAGTVVDPNGDTVEGAVVELLSHADDPVARREARTDAAGRFAFESLAEGTYRLAAAVVRDDVARTFAVASPEAGDDGVVLRLAAPSVMAGRLLDSDGAPLAGVRVEAHIEHAWLGRTSFGAPEASAETDEQGRFRIEGIAGERCRLTFGYAETRVGTTAVLPSPDPVAMGAEHEFRLARGGAIEGTVFTPDGARYADAWVRIVGAGRQVASLRPDRDGRFRVSGLAAGLYTVEASGNYVDQGGGIRMAAWHAKVPDVAPGDAAIVVRLGPTAR